ncbi:MAG: glycosyltransferase family 4 protein, partial [Bacteroidetes bacterium]|nr:glycosyltransferase family 4 protein [Bacteroidota bacterium]
MDFQNQSQMPAVLQACDLFCLPSKGPGETWGLGVNEAMACAKAVMTSDKVGCAIDLVRKAYNGDIFKSGDVVGMSDCLDRLTKSRESLVEMGRNSTLIIKDWSFLHIAEAIEHAVAAAK